ncbi:MAG: L-histidine N(alpha)-methyltransferase [Candidatus Eisenbacteria bacterium]
MSTSLLEVEVHLDEQDLVQTMKQEVAHGLRQRPRQIPPKFFYDERGSQLFERITELPEYYLTRAERALLDRAAPGIAERCGCSELLELGSGSSAKTRVLLNAMKGAGLLEKYVPVDVSETMVRETADQLRSEYPKLAVHAVIGDFTRHLHLLPHGERRLVAFLGSTVGNFERDSAVALLREVASALGPQDRFLLGTDLVKDQAVLEAAYNDSEGVTAEFNRNALRVLNQQLDADFVPERFEHVAFFDRVNSWIEMRLRSTEDQTVTIPGLEMVLDLSEGEEIRTEISCKYTRESVEDLLREAGMKLVEWLPDEREYFALSLAARG